LSVSSRKRTSDGNMAATSSDGRIDFAQALRTITWDAEVGRVESWNCTTATVGKDFPDIRIRGVKPARIDRSTSSRSRAITAPREPRLYWLQLDWPIARPGERSAAAMRRTSSRDIIAVSAVVDAQMGLDSLLLWARPAQPVEIHGLDLMANSRRALTVPGLVPTPALLGVGSKTGGCRFDSCRAC